MVEIKELDEKDLNKVRILESLGYLLSYSVHTRTQQMISYILKMLLNFPFFLPIYEENKLLVTELAA